MGKGVIITQRENLDEVLFYIITKNGTLAESNDPAYTAWRNDLFDSFIVEEFVASDPLMIPHLENRIYQPTMRVAFLLVYDKNCHHVHFLGGYWKTPLLSMDEEGDFMQKNKDIDSITTKQKIDSLMDIDYLKTKVGYRPQAPNFKIDIQDSAHVII